MELSDLDDHLIDEIVSHLLVDTSSLLNASLVSTRFCRLSRRYLYRYISLSLSYGLSDSRVRRFENFLRTIRKKPDYAKYVHSMSLDWVRESRKIHYLVNRLLAKLHNLRSLSLRGGYALNYNEPYLHFQPEFLNSNSMDNLKRVNIENPALMWTLLVFLSASGEVAITARNMSLNTGSIDFSTDFQSSLPLESLSLRGCSFTKNDLQGLFTIRPNIQKLVCPVPAVGFDEINNPETILDSLLRTSLRLLQEALEPVQHSLVELELTGDFNTWNGGYDGQALDFRGFEALKTLRAYQYCFFRSKNQTLGESSREGMYLLLPPTLVNLEIMFNLDTGMLYKSGTEEAHFSETYGNVDPWRYSWLMELALYKKQCFSSLQSVAIRECQSDESQDLIAWKPQCLIEAFEGAGIKLSILLRPIQELEEITEMSRVIG